MTDHASTGLRVRVPQVKGQIKLRKTKTAYLGSVRFFKHLIVTVLVILITVPWGVVAYMAGRGQVSRDAMLLLENRLAAVNDEKQSLFDEYEERLEQAALEQEELRLLLHQMETQLTRAETIYEFQSAYGHLHPELWVEGPKEYIDSSRTVYLTFDDGPGGSTKSILEILQRYDIPATFFIVGYTIPGREATLRQVAEAGHTIGVHTYSHVYRDIYSSLEAFLDDFSKASTLIEEVTGMKPDIFRFPGGSMNIYNETWGNTIISEMLSRGYRYYDWNVGSGDTSVSASAETIYDAVIRQVNSNPYGVVLMHDGGGNRSQTVEALPRIIERLLREGYRFDKLTNQVRPTVFAPTSFSRG
ncbi:MAG: polysaccharide deacetylase [Clostridiales bacterium]|nr:polysaccharide deacetylase [Clostridiales bacterium]